jgi:hypothetical protein
MRAIWFAPNNSVSSCVVAISSTSDRLEQNVPLVVQPVGVLHGFVQTDKIRVRGTGDLVEKEFLNAVRSLLESAGMLPFHPPCPGSTKPFRPLSE